MFITVAQSSNNVPIVAPQNLNPTAAPYYHLLINSQNHKTKSTL
jgi:hypothetical protein